MTNEIPKTEMAVQLIGPDELTLNKEKPVPRPNPYQILAKVEAVGLCFSDLKLLKQFTSHARKSEITSGIESDILEEIPSYVTGEKPTVPGHEASVRVLEVGDKVRGIEPGKRYLVQTDYRWLPTAKSNAAFGYNFEGALQQFVLMDQRVITSPDGESMLIPASDELSASSVALIEPWACVEDAYAAKERRKLKTHGKMIVLNESDLDRETIVACISSLEGIEDTTYEICDNVSEHGEALYDDIIYFGSNPETVERLFSNLAAGGLFNIVLCGGKFGRDISTPVGRVHYGYIRVIGTNGSDPAEAMSHIPATGEIRENDIIDVVGAAGPMGVMHVIRNICQGVNGITVLAGDLDGGRLKILDSKSEPLAKKRNVRYFSYISSAGCPEEKVDYAALMVPSPQLVADCVKRTGENGIINIFAGIPAEKTADIDLDGYIERHLYFIGTSGSELSDMKTVLAKVENGQLDTNISLATVCGLPFAEKGIRAIEKRLTHGKIVVYPGCEDLPFFNIEDLAEKSPETADKLDNGLWTKAAEDTLLKQYKN